MVVSKHLAFAIISVVVATNMELVLEMHSVAKLLTNLLEQLLLGFAPGTGGA